MNKHQIDIAFNANEIQKIETRARQMQAEVLVDGIHAMGVWLHKRWTAFRHVVGHQTV